MLWVAVQCGDPHGEDAHQLILSELLEVEALNFDFKTLEFDCVHEEPCEGEGLVEHCGVGSRTSGGDLGSEITNIDTHEGITGAGLVLALQISHLYDLNLH